MGTTVGTNQKPKNRKMGRLFLRYLDECPSIYRCNTCHAHLANTEDIVSREFQGTLGRAYLFSGCVNVCCGPREERLLVTGMHIVCDIFCVKCQTIVGWKYIEAYEHEQKYKENKVILEKARMYKDNSNARTPMSGSPGVVGVRAEG
eukprot:GDKI01040610.1.p1 GENE.GDKI01040610.1~~GDKI01040610.1.p1  ORF type:complete len:147 (-),score=16.83 GDKI01040610.1:99-539(-)